MIKGQSLVKDAAEIKFYSLGYCVGDPTIYSFVCSFCDLHGRRTQASLKARVNERNWAVMFEPCYKKMFSKEDVEDAIEAALAFTRLMRLTAMREVSYK